MYENAKCKVMKYWMKINILLEKLSTSYWFNYLLWRIKKMFSFHHAGFFLNYYR